MFSDILETIQIPNSREMLNKEESTVQTAGASQESCTER